MLGDVYREIGFRAEDQFDITDRVAGFDGYRDLPNITRGLVKRGYSDEQVQGIPGENALRVFGAICADARELLPGLKQRIAQPRAQSALSVARTMGYAAPRLRGI